MQPKSVSLTLELKHDAGGGCNLLFDLLQDTKLESPILAKRNRLNVLLQVSNTMPIIFADLFPVLFAFYAACGGREGGSEGGRGGGTQCLGPRLPAVINKNIGLHVHWAFSTVLFNEQRKKSSKRKRGVESSRLIKKIK